MTLTTEQKRRLLENIVGTLSHLGQDAQLVRSYPRELRAMRDPITCMAFGLSIGGALIKFLEEGGLD